jgi:hypothetical protein
MIHLYKFNEVNRNKDIKDYLYDIFMPLVDDGFFVKVSSDRKNNFNSQRYSVFKVDITSIEDFKLALVSDDIFRSITYLSSEDISFEYGTISTPNKRPYLDSFSKENLDLLESDIKVKGISLFFSNYSI